MFLGPTLVDDQTAKMQATIARQKRVMDKQRQKISEYEECKIYFKHYDVH